MMNGILSGSIVTVKEKVILTSVKAVRNTLFGTMATGVKTAATEQRSGSALNAAKTMEITAKARGEESVGEKLLRGDTSRRGILVK